MQRNESRKSYIGLADTTHADSVLNSAGISAVVYFHYQKISVDTRGPVVPEAHDTLFPVTYHITLTPRRSAGSDWTRHGLYDISR